MYAKIVTTTIVEVSQAGFDSLKELDASAIVSKLDVAGVGSVEITEISDADHASNTDGTNKVDDEWDDEYCDVPEPSDDAPEDDNV